MSVNSQLELLGLSKGAYYYKPKGESAENLELMNAIDREHTEHPTKGVEGMVDHLFLLGFLVGPKRVRRLMRKMNITAIYPKKNLSKLGKPQYRMPYLLRGLDIARPNHVWSIDITYIPMLHGFMYITAIIDVYSRCIMAWGLHKTIVSTNRPLDKENSIEVLRRAVEAHGAPEIINSDQGCQYTSNLWLSTCEELGIKVSMDGHGRCKDNIWIERFWRTIKTEYIYINPEDNVPLLRQGIRDYIEYYNNRRSHQGIAHQIPMERYRNAA